MPGKHPLADDFHISNLSITSHHCWHNSDEASSRGHGGCGDRGRLDDHVLCDCEFLAQSKALQRLEETEPKDSRLQAAHCDLEWGLDLVRGPAVTRCPASMQQNCLPHGGSNAQGTMHNKGGARTHPVCNPKYMLLKHSRLPMASPDTMARAVNSCASLRGSSGSGGSSALRVTSTMRVAHGALGS